MKRLILILFIFSIQHSYSQEFKYSRIDSTVFKAMRDEMNRSMHEYKHTEAGGFFYIMYQIDDVKSLTSIATLGCLMNSKTDNARATSYRIMVGDYNLNDENFTNFSGEETGNEYNPMINAPLGDDYWGIRRSLWSYTEAAFKNCTKSYLAKKKYFLDNPQSKPTLPDFSEADSVSFLRTSNVNLDQNKADAFTRKVSSIFKKYKEITESSVSFNQVNVNVYLLSTEGTICKIPLDYTLVSVSASITTDTVDERNMTEQISFYDTNPENLFNNTDRINASAEKLANYLIEVNKASELKEKYNGPVILNNQASCQYFYNTLFNSNLSLIARRDNISDNSRYNSQFLKRNSIEDKVGKKIGPAELSVIDRPFLESYDGKKLLGTSYIDQEGVVPPSELTLVEKGELKNLLSTRVPTASTPKSNGHRRFGVSTQSSIVSVLPSNLFVSLGQGKEKSEIKHKLINICKESGLEYGIEIRPLDDNADDSPFVYYKINVDGTEELVKPMIFPRDDLKSLNKVIESTSKTFTSNTVQGGAFNYMGQGSFSGCFMSIIAPSTILIKDIEINTNRFQGGYSEY